MGNFLQGLKGKEAAVTKDTTTSTSSSSFSGAADVTFDLSMLRGSGRVIEMIGITIEKKKQLCVCTYTQNICMYMCARVCACVYVCKHTPQFTLARTRTHTHTETKLEA